jgi:hypothetical protein
MSESYKTRFSEAAECRNEMARKHIHDFSEGLNKNFNTFEKLEDYCLTNPTKAQIQIKKFPKTVVTLPINIITR